MTRRRQPRRLSADRLTLLAFVAAALAVVRFFRPTADVPTAPVPNALVASRAPSASLSAGASLNAFGASRAVKLRFALPGARIEFPLEVSDPSSLSYAWVGSDSVAVDAPRSLRGADIEVPEKPGFYHL